MVAFGQLSSLVALAEDLEIGDRRGDSLQKGVNGVLIAEITPDRPGCILGGSALVGHGSTTGLVRKVEISEESVAGGKVTMCQFWDWG